MQVVGLEALRESYPNHELRWQGAVFDVHNDGMLDSIEYNFETEALTLRWVLKNAARRSAAVQLTVTGVQSLSVTGELQSAQNNDHGLDFIEYRPLSQGQGELRFALDVGGVVTVVGRRCELRTTRGGC